MLPGVTVVVTNEETGLTRNLVTDANGEFTAPQVPTGTYTVTAELSGFKKVSKSNYRVGVDSRVRVDFVLDIGAMSETVTVVAETPLVQTSSSELGTTVTQEQISALPLNGRNFVNLTRVIPGVLRGVPGANIDGAGSLAWRASASFSANGQRARDNNFMLDGVDNNETWLQTVVIFPSPDALEEFKMQTSTYSAEFGRSLGGVVNLHIKSGTNTLRGSAFEFYRNDAFDANNFFNNRARPAEGRPEPARVRRHHRRQDRPGQDVLLPVVPGTPRESRADVPVHRADAAMRNGDFSAINRVIYDPTTGQPFPGNVIPSNRIDTVAQEHPRRSSIPSRTPRATSGPRARSLNNYLINPIKERQDNQLDSKFDHNLVVEQPVLRALQLPEDAPPAARHAAARRRRRHVRRRRRQHQGAGAGVQRHPHVQQRLAERGPVRLDVDQVLHDADRLPARTRRRRSGIPGINLNDATSAMTQLNFQNIRNLGANGNQPLITNQNDFAFFDNVTWIKGKHSFKMGGNMTFRSREILNADTIVGNFHVQQQHDVELRGPARRLHHQQRDRVRRGELPARDHERQDPQPVRREDLHREATRVRRLLPGRLPPDQPPDRQHGRPLGRLPAVPRGGRPAVELRPDDGQVRAWRRLTPSSPASTVGRRLQTYSKKDIGPRFGFAYDLKGDGSLMVRGGFGIYWNYTPGGTSSSKAQNPPFLQATALTPTPTGYGVNLLLKDGLPPPPGVDPNRPPAGQTRSIFDINFRDAYARQCNVNVQKSFGANYMLEVAYVGSQGRQMLTKIDPNEAPRGRRRDRLEHQPAVPTSCRPLLRSLGQVASVGYVDYNALQIKFQRRFANNFSFLNSFTWGKSIDLNSDNDGQVTRDQRLRLEGYNRAVVRLRHPVHVQPDVDLGSSVGAREVVRRLAAERPVAGPRRPAADHHADAGACSPRAARTQPAEPDLRRRARRTRRSTSGSTRRASQSPGRHHGHVGQLRPQHPARAGSFNIDASLIKNTRIGPVQTEIRLEAFNVLNHPQFGNPNTTFGNAAFGQITAMLSSPSCSLCGTVERQIQLGVKMRF